MKNRIIKFRIWDGEKMTTDPAYILNKEFLAVATIDKPLYIDINTLINKFQSESEVMEFTGLTDKNGVEIYEGDIVIIKGFHPMKVEFDRGEFSCNDDSLYDWLSDSPKVIGNIYENPELL